MHAKERWVARRGLTALASYRQFELREGMIELIEEPEEAWEACERALDARGTPVPLYHRAIWARANRSSGTRSLFISIRDVDKICRAGFAVESQRSRALPGHRLLSVVRFGAGSSGLDASALDAGVAALSAFARRDRSVLRLTVQTFTLDQELRGLTSEALRRHGFLPVATTRTYERTLVVDLTPDENALLSGFHYNARRRIRNIEKHPLRVTTAESVALAPRLQELADETHSRTGGEPQQLDWRSIIRMSAEAPHLSRIAILERTDRDGPDAVLAFAWGCMHGRVAEYSESGSTRPEDMKVSTSYALMWDLMSWARRSGAQLFDLGGVTEGSASSDDPLGGISDFKRFFSQREVEVGQQWLLEPHPARAKAARVIAGSARILRHAASRFGSRKQ
jgi:hypothetical protein